jgi:protein phosphatase 2C family protein 2/3
MGLKNTNLNSNNYLSPSNNSNKNSINNTNSNFNKDKLKNMEGKSKSNILKSNLNNNPSNTQYVNNHMASSNINNHQTKNQFNTITNVDSYTNKTNKVPPNTIFNPNSYLNILNKNLKKYENAKFSSKSNSHVEAYGANTNQGSVRNYNEDRVSIILNVIKPSSRDDEEWPKVSFFGIYDGHGGNKCADYLKENLHQHVNISIIVYFHIFNSSLILDFQREMLP